MDSDVGWHPAADGRSTSIRPVGSLPPARAPSLTPLEVLLKVRQFVAAHASCESPSQADAAICTDVSSACGRGGDGSEAASASAPSVCARLPASWTRGQRPVIAWKSAGFARRFPSREGLGTLSGFPSDRSRKDPDPEGAMAAQGAAGGRAAAEVPSPARPPTPSEASGVAGVAGEGRPSVVLPDLAFVR
jgi:hypothetical protein